jgi:uncharacterized protein YjbI with pentapeptide repeats
MMNRARLARVWTVPVRSLFAGLSRADLKGATLKGADLYEAALSGFGTDFARALRLGVA